MTAKKKDYETGYGKPPKHHQWKKGQSGNPSGGRKKKKMAQPMPDIIAEAFSQRVSIVRDGKHERVPLAEAYVFKLLMSSMNSSPKVMLDALKAFEKLDVFMKQRILKEDMEEPYDYDGPDYDEEDLRILEIVERRLAEVEESDDVEASGGSVVIGRDDIEDDGEEENPGDDDEPSGPAPDDLYGENDEGLLRW